MAAASLPTVIVLALGAAALGGPDALRALLQFTGQNPCLDIAICMSVMFVVTAYVLGAVLLVRFVRDAAGGAHHGHGAAATDCIAQVSLLVSVCVGFLVAACLVALPPSVPSGGLGTLGFFTYLADKNFIAVAVIAAAAAWARWTGPLLRFVRGAGNAGDEAPGARFSRTRQTACFLFIALPLILAVVSSVASSILDAQRIFPGFPCLSPITDMSVGVAVATVVGTTLVVVRFSCTSTWRRRFGKLTSLAVVAGLLAMAYAHSESMSKSDGWEHAYASA